MAEVAAIALWFSPALGGSHWSSFSNLSDSTPGEEGTVHKVGERECHKSGTSQ